MAATRRGHARDGRRRSPSQREVLPNGVVVVSLPMAHARHTALAIGVRVGSRHEPTELGGISHFLEHMLFRGTAEHPTSFAQNFAFESLGGTLDAATSAETTVFSTSVPRDAAADAIALIAEMFREPVMAGLELERNVVKEEILDTLDEQDQLVDPDELVAQALFGAHPLGRSIGGTVASIEAIREEDLRAWHRRHYVGSNVTVTLAGALGPRALAAVRRELGAIPRGRPTRTSPVVPAHAHDRHRVVRTTGSQVDVRVAVRAIGAGDPRFTALSMLARILDDGMSARVFRALVEDRGLAYEAFGNLDPYSDASIFALGATCRPESTVAVTDALLALAAGARGPLAAGELARVQTRALFELSLARDEPEAMAEVLLGGELRGDRLDIDDLEARARAVTEADVVALAAETFRAERLSVVAVGRVDARTRKAIERAAERWT
ncbi:MAG: pitrilysin family protein [Sandaracinaceae bacterium]